MDRWQFSPLVFCCHYYWGIDGNRQTDRQTDRRRERHGRRTCAAVGLVSSHGVLALNRSRRLHGLRSYTAVSWVDRYRTHETPYNCSCHQQQISTSQRFKNVLRFKSCHVFMSFNGFFFIFNVFLLRKRQNFQLAYFQKIIIMSTLLKIISQRFCIYDWYYYLEKRLLCCHRAKSLREFTRWM